MGLNGKTVLFLGDSITEGAMASTPEKTYVNVLKNTYGINAVNCGEGGTRIARQIAPSEIAAYDRDFVMRAEELKDVSPHAIVVFGGTNDYGHGDVPIRGSGVYSFSGALAILIDILRKKFPGAKLLFVTPMHRLHEDNVYGDGSKREPSGTLGEYADEMRRVCKAKNAALLDLFADKDFFVSEKDYLRILYSDGIHPNDGGHRLLAEKIAKGLDGLL